MRYASKTLKHKKGFYHRKYRPRSCSSVFDLPLNQPSSPLSPGSDESVIDEIFSAFAASSPYVIESLESVEPDRSRVSTADTLPTVPEGTPVLVHKPTELEPFPREPIKSTPVKVSRIPTKPRITTLDRWHLRELERIYYSNNVWKYHRIKAVRFGWRAMRARVKALLGYRAEVEVKLPVRSVKSPNVECLLWDGSSEESISCSEVLPRIRGRRSKQKIEFEKKVVQSETVPNSQRKGSGNCDEHSLRSAPEKVKPKSSPRDDDSNNHPGEKRKPPVPGSRDSSWQLVKKPINLKPQKWDKSTTERFNNMILQEHYGNLIKSFMSCQKRVTLSKDFLLELNFSGSQGFSGFQNAVSMALKARSAVDELEGGFRKMIPLGIKSAEFSKCLGIKLPELDHHWAWSRNEGSSNIETKMHLDTQGHLSVNLLLDDKNEKKGVSESTSNPGPDSIPRSRGSDNPSHSRFAGAESLCTTADDLIRAARDILG
ncbi:uncharacterized protein CXQ87_004934 [Candidozyma duobushaemuli]|uniref:Uncharacterized protein n=2 Tax=Candidozyma TaxID=3303203 RepID=A0ABX8IBC9_9ASCO|nr:uncharacterized protein CXQ87_004934 [[Candida] duobushaemulonis]PVH16639.1 hypothetical protein CXQ87_004934 [[Candida] duobushaemulonis]QWU90392.1 hypothetical protein CA3LBN_004753 [[Candida] haemuloni]